MRPAESLCRDQIHPYEQALLGLNMLFNFLFSKHRRSLLQFTACESAIFIAAVTPQDVQLTVITDIQAHVFFVPFISG